MGTIAFHKMSGSGNDFILIDNRDPVVPMEDLPHFVAKVCRRGMSVGADGLILVESSDRADFKWRFFNSDGSVAAMCGNGARCAARFAYLTGIAKARMAFETLAGVIGAQVRGDQVRIAMSDPRDLVLDDTVELASGVLNLSHVDTGVPHAVIEVADTARVDVDALGRDIRFHPRFAPSGANVNFIAPLGASLWAIRTYERGVEGETLACGTGNVAAALVLSRRYGLTSPVTLKTHGGSRLQVDFEQADGRFVKVGLEGDARVVYEGRMGPEAWKY